MDMIPQHLIIISMWQYTSHAGEKTITLLNFENLAFVLLTLLYFQDDVGLTPLTIACVNGHIRCAQTLIEHGAIIDIVDKVCQCSYMNFKSS